MGSHTIALLNRHKIPIFEVREYLHQKKGQLTVPLLM